MLPFILDILISYHYYHNSKRNQILKDIQFFLENFKEFSCQGSYDTRLPRRFSKDLFYLTGLIMGDGSLPLKHSGNGGRNYEIYIEKANYTFIRDVVKPLFSELFQNNNIRITKEPKNINKIRYRAHFHSRVVFQFLEKILSIPTGKKSDIIRFPTALQELSFDNKIAFFAGLVDTDWGRIRWKCFGTHMSSKGLSQDYKQLFNNLGLGLNIKKYIQKERFVSYQCYMNKGEEQKLFNILKHYYPLKNKKRIKTIQAGMAERLMRQT